ncbi:hypothetical protein PT2222_200035 [Paraburkholderia tropica]
MRGRGVALRDHLDGVAHAHGQRAAIQNRGRGAQEIGEAQRFDGETDREAHEPARHELGNRERERIVTRRVMAHEHHLNADHERAAELIPVPIHDREMLVDAEQIEPDGGERRTDPRARTGVMAQQDAEHRHDHDVKRADETRVGDLRVAQADLLQGDRHGEHEAEDRAVAQQGGVEERASSDESRGAGIVALIVVIAAGTPPAPQREHKHRDDQRTEQKADAGEKKRTDGVEAQSLGDEGGAPDHGGGQHQQIGAQVLAGGGVQAEISVRAMRGKPWRQHARRQARPGKPGKAQ